MTNADISDFNYINIYINSGAVVLIQIWEIAFLGIRYLAGYTVGECIIFNTFRSHVVRAGAMNFVNSLQCEGK